MIEGSVNMLNCSLLWLIDAYNN